MSHFNVTAGALKKGSSPPLRLGDMFLEDLADFAGALLRVSLLVALIVYVRDAEARFVALRPFEVTAGTR